jgi:hypothetical protein
VDDSSAGLAERFPLGFLAVSSIFFRASAFGA